MGEPWSILFKAAFTDYAWYKSTVVGIVVVPDLEYNQFISLRCQGFIFIQYCKFIRMTMFSIPNNAIILKSNFEIIKTS